MPGDQVTRDDAAEYAGAAGDEHRTVRVQGTGDMLPGCLGHGAEPWREQLAVAQRQLRLAGGQCRREDFRGQSSGAGRVQQHQPPWMLGLG